MKKNNNTRFKADSRSRLYRVCFWFPFSPKLNLASSPGMLPSQPGPTLARPPGSALNPNPGRLRLTASLK